MPIVNEKARILAREMVRPDIYRITLSSPRIARQAVPGQFVMTRVSGSYDPLLRRPFSIHYVIKENSVVLLVKAIGKGTRELCLKNIGEAVELLGPLGRGFSLEGDKFCLVAGGIGIAPLLFTAHVLTEQKKEVVALLGARNEGELFELADFITLGIQVDIATDDGSSGYHGSVIDLVHNHIPQNDTSWTLLSCGPKGMLAALAKICTQGGWQCQVSLEAHMACGIEACLGCAVPAAGNPLRYLHVCKDGPVFTIDEIGW